MPPFGANAPLSPGGGKNLYFKQLFSFPHRGKDVRRTGWGLTRNGSSYLPDKYVIHSYVIYSFSRFYLMTADETGAVHRLFPRRLEFKNSKRSPSAGNDHAVTR